MEIVAGHLQVMFKEVTVFPDQSRLRSNRIWVRKALDI
jgi:hypothetical protein